MPTDRRLNVLVLGDDSTADMEPVREALRCVSAIVDLRSARDATTLTDRAQVNDPWFPDLIVVCQNWPDEFSSANVHELLATYPLSRLVCCYGPWCESDGRNRSIWPSGCRVPVAHAARRITREVDSLRSGGTDEPPPLTAARDEVFEFECAKAILNSQAVSKVPGTVVSPDPALRRMLTAAFTACGGRVLPESEAGGCRFVLWDADPWSPVRRQMLIDLRDRSPSAAIIAVVGLACASFTEELLAAGANRVIPKLAPLEQLAAALRELVSQNHAAKV